jgi:hypothetical protein
VRNLSSGAIEAASQSRFTRVMVSTLMDFGHAFRNSPWQLIPVRTG